jgi:hypothetical protein
MTLEVAKELAFYREAETFVKAAGGDVLCCYIECDRAVKARSDRPYQCRGHAPTAVGRMDKQPGNVVASIATKPNDAIVVLHHQNLRLPKEDLHLGITI